MKKYYLIALIFVVLDQITKWYFQFKDIDILSFFSFTYVENTGAAFGIFQGWNLVFFLISIIAIVICFYYFKQYPLPITFILAGVIGNGIDRLVYGYVRDFIAISIWPVFNLADSFNTIGVILLAYAFYKEEKAYKQSKPKK